MIKRTDLMARLLQTSVSRTTASIVLGLIMVGCSASERWKEEVRLSDGRIIVIERETAREGGGDEWAHNRGGSKPKKYYIRFVSPDRPGQTIEWQSTKVDDRRWPEFPLVFDIISGNPVVFTRVGLPSGCSIYSEYIYRDGGWSEVPLPEIFEPRPTNLLLRSGTKMPRFVSLEAKRKANAEIGYNPALRQVGPKRQVCG